MITYFRNSGPEFHTKFFSSHAHTKELKYTVNIEIFPCNGGIPDSV